MVIKANLVAPMAPDTAATTHPTMLGELVKLLYERGAGEVIVGDSPGGLYTAAYLNYVYKVTGLLCPGCGNSRAAMALLGLDIRRALEYNLLFPLEFFYIAWVYFFCCRRYLKEGRFSYQPPCIAFDIFVLSLLVIWWVVRNLI